MAKKLEHRTKSRQELIMEAVLWMNWERVRKVIELESVTADAIETKTYEEAL